MDDFIGGDVTDREHPTRFRISQNGFSIDAHRASGCLTAMRGQLVGSTPVEVNEQLPDHLRHKTLTGFLWQLRGSK
jgi:hypothetical protein